MFVCKINTLSHKKTQRTFLALTIRLQNGVSFKCFLCESPSPFKTIDCVASLCGFHCDFMVRFSSFGFKRPHAWINYCTTLLNNENWNAFVFKPRRRDNIGQNNNQKTETLCPTS